MRNYVGLSRKYSHALSLICTWALLSPLLPRFSNCEDKLPVSSRIKPSILKKIVEDREVMTYATLNQSDYSFYIGMLVKSGRKKTQTILTDYRLYAKIIHYIEKADYNSKTGVLDLVGKIWKFQLTSSILFRNHNESTVHYQVMGGHLLGLQGEIFFESYGEKGTLVYMTGKKKGGSWPPKLIIEEGAKVVFDYAGKSMRSYVENLK